MGSTCEASGLQCLLSTTMWWGARLGWGRQESSRGQAEFEQGQGYKDDIGQGRHLYRCSTRWLWWSQFPLARLLNFLRLLRWVFSRAMLSRYLRACASHEYAWMFFTPAQRGADPRMR